MDVTKADSKEKKEDLERSWSNLPDDLVITKLSTMSLVDQIHCSAVCKNWKQLTKGIRPADKLPWLLLYDWESSDEGHIKNACKLFVPAHQKAYTLKVRCKEEELRNFAEATAWCSGYGWVVFGKNQGEFPYITAFSLAALSAFTCETLKLPELEVANFPQVQEESTGFSLRKVAFSSSPSSSDCLFFALTSWSLNDGNMISTCRVGDSAWKTAEIKGIDGVVKDATYFDGTLYCLFSWETLGAFDVAKQQWSCLYRSSIPPPNGLMDTEFNKLVMFDGQLLRLVSIKNVEWRIWRFDLSEKKWVNQVSLGDHAAFISRTSFVIQATREASEYADTINTHTNRIYSFKTGKRMKEPLEIYNKAPKGLSRFFIQPSEVSL